MKQREPNGRRKKWEISGQVEWDGRAQTTKKIEEITEIERDE